LDNVFSGGLLSSTGVAPGYIRFSNNIYWSSILTGTIILLYNTDDISSAITNLYGPTPSKYDQTTNPIIIPLPNSKCTTCTSIDTLYIIGNSISPNGTTPVYDNTREGPAWNQISLRAVGDGVVRRYQAPGSRYRESSG
jgi:hypothetical protein